VTGEFHDVICVLVLFNVGDPIFHTWKGAREDSDCFHLGVCQVTGVKVVGSHIGLELLTPIVVGTRCDTRIEEPAPRFSEGNVAIRLPNLGSIVSVSDSDTWVGVFLDLPSARVFDGRLEVRALRPRSFHKKVRCEGYILQCKSGAFRDYFSFSNCSFRELGGVMGTCAMFRLNRTQ